MIVRVLDKNSRLTREIRGHVDYNVFHYKEGGINIPLINLRIGGEDKTMDIIYSDSIDEKKDKVNYVRFDGKNYTPLTIAEVGYKHEKHSTEDYLMYSEKGRLAKASILTKPLGVLELVAIAIAIVTILTMFGFYLATSNIVTQLTLAVKPINQSVQMQAIQLKILQNQTQQLEHLYNLTIQKLNTLPNVG